MAATKSPISLDPLIGSDGVSGRITRAIVQPGCTIRLGLKRHVCVPGSALGYYAVLANSSGVFHRCRTGNLQGRRGRICAPMVHDERAKREGSSWYRGGSALRCADWLYTRKPFDIPGNTYDKAASKPLGKGDRGCDSIRNRTRHSARTSGTSIVGAASDAGRCRISMPNACVCD
jgi:hypothetical protein